LASPLWVRLLSASVNVLIKESFMKHKRPPVAAIVLLALIVLVGGYFGIRALLNPGSTSLTASGTIEAVEITISPEIGGKVVAVPVEEGAPVKAGEVLFRLDDTLLQGQRAVALASLNLAQAASATGDASLASAQANYTVILDNARLASAPSRTLDWRAASPAGYDLPGGYFSLIDQIRAAQAEVDASGSARDAADKSLNVLLADPANSTFVAVEKRLSNTRAASIAAQDVLTRATASNNTDLRNSAQVTFDAARTELDDAQSAYDDLKGSEAAGKIITARADLSAARERSESALDHLLALQTGENSPQVAAAQAVLTQAQAVADQAHMAIMQAEASLALIEAQVVKLTVTAPVNGVILMRSIQPGEILAPSAAAMTLGLLDNLSITVYVPENLYGGLSLGQSASVTADSFPGETFNGTVTHIADQAEFTPRNVQTAEGRSTTVFAIKLQIQDTAGKLKPGMPADVVFGK
jgi:HlyD family secretion protein